MEFAESFDDVTQTVTPAGLVVAVGDFQVLLAGFDGQLDWSNLFVG
ncbi:MAG: hypothetical protein OXG44_20200 [Gammaproteobacteria bacterium]|nr:hypothetical protein [Gammaproteobacteria bacterium]